MNCHRIPPTSGQYCNVAGIYVIMKLDKMIFNHMLKVKLVNLSLCFSNHYAMKAHLMLNLSTTS